MGNENELPLIDGHSHSFTMDVAGNLVGVMERLDLKAFNVCAICHIGGARIAQNPLCLMLKLMHPGKVYACGGLMHKPPGRAKEASDLRSQAERLISLGFDGIKMLEGKPTAYKKLGIPLNDPIYDEYYSWVVSQQIPVVFHVADPETFWDPEKVPPHFLKMGWCYDDGTYPEKEQLYEQIDDILTRFGEMRVIFAHFYFLSADIDRAGAFLDTWPSVSFDITPGMEMYGNFSQKADQWSEFFTKYADRIVFGTDNICSVDRGDLASSIKKIQSMRRFLATRDEFRFGRYDVRGLGLDRSVLAKIYAGNFERLFGSRPRPVRKQDALAYCRELAAQAETVPVGADALADLKRIIDTIEKLPV